MQSLIRRRVLRHLIWVYTVCSSLSARIRRVSTVIWFDQTLKKSAPEIDTFAIDLYETVYTVCYSTFEFCITKTCLYNFDPLKSHFYIVKLGFTGVYICFLISAQNVDYGYSLEPFAKAVLTSTHNLCFKQKYKNKNQSFLSQNFHFWRSNFLYTWIGMFS